MPNIMQDRLWRGGRLSNHLSRLQHFRGHGVHSPFIYSIIRNVYMSRRLSSGATRIFEMLHPLKIRNSVAVEIANLAAHCNYNRLSIDCLEEGSDMIVTSPNCSEATIEELTRKAAQRGIAIVILSPYKQSKLSNSLLKWHSCASIDRLNYMILLNNHLPKQHFKL